VQLLVGPLHRLVEGREPDVGQPAVLAWIAVASAYASGGLGFVRARTAAARSASALSTGTISIQKRTSISSTRACVPTRNGPMRISE